MQWRDRPRSKNIEDRRGDIWYAYTDVYGVEIAAKDPRQYTLAFTNTTPDQSIEIGAFKGVLIDYNGTIYSSKTNLFNWTFRGGRSADSMTKKFLDTSEWLTEEQHLTLERMCQVVARNDPGAEFISQSAHLVELAQSAVYRYSS